jgi:predicted metal-binding protein
VSITFFSCDCGECPGPPDLENTLEDVFTDNAIENITFKQWILTDRCELITTVKSTEEFIESLLEILLLQLCHSIIATQQAMFLRQLKCNLQSGESVVL